MNLKLITSVILVLFVQNIASRCPEPRCDTEENILTLWSHDNAFKYWQCRRNDDGIWIPVERDCSPTGNKFSFEHQVCVWPSDYIASCATYEEILLKDLNDEPENCGEDIPACTTEYEKNTLYAHDDVKQFWQCKPDPDGYWTPLERPCAPGTWFCKNLQVCIWPRDWSKEMCGCEGNLGSSTTIQTTPTTTSRPTTTPTTTTTKKQSTPTKPTKPPIPTTPGQTQSTPGQGPTDPPGAISGEEPGPCDAPRCDTMEEQNTLYANANVSVFWQCKPDADGYWSPIERPCAPGTWFCSDEQVCIWPRDWTAERCGCDSSIVPDPSTSAPTSENPITTNAPSSEVPTTQEPTSENPITTNAPSSEAPTTQEPENPITTDPPGVVSGEEPGPCEAPICDTMEQRNTLYSHLDVTKFWQCKPDPDGYWSPIERPCAPGTWFCSDEQVCIWPRDWTAERCGCDSSIVPDPSTSAPTSENPITTNAPSSEVPTTQEPTSENPITTNAPSSEAPTTQEPENPITTDPPGGISGEEPGPCEAPICDTMEQRNTLYSHLDVTKFWQCIPVADGSWSPIERPCAPGTWFCSDEQVCIWPRDWTAERCGCDSSIVPDPSTSAPTSENPITTNAPSSEVPTTQEPTSENPITTNAPSSEAPTTQEPENPITTDPPGGISGEEPGPCEAPICDTMEQRNTLYSHLDVTKFWQCIPVADGSWSPIERPCAPGTWFCSDEQVCIWPRDWTAERCGCDSSIVPDPSTSAPTSENPITTNAPSSEVPTTQEPTSENPITTNAPSSEAPTTQEPENPITTDPPGGISGEEPGPCEAPICDTMEQRNTLYSHLDVTKFWQCIPVADGSWSPIERPCAPGTWFCSDEQVCIWPRDWTAERCGCDSSIVPDPSTSAPTSENPITTNAPSSEVPTTQEPTSENPITTNAPSSEAPTTQEPENPITTDPPGGISGEEPGPCEAPICDTMEQRNTLYSHLDVTKFWQCIPVADGSWSPIERPCAPGTWFCSDEQVCIWPRDWTAERCGCDSSIVPDPSTSAPTSENPITTNAPSSEVPTTQEPTSENPITTNAPSSEAPTTQEPENPITTDPPGGISGEEPGPCEAPICDTMEQRNTLYSHLDVTKFWQCIPVADGSWSPIERPCAPGTWFCSDEQVCIWPRDWTAERCGCDSSIVPDPSTSAPTSENPITTNAPSSEAPTTQEPTSENPITTNPPSSEVPTSENPIETTTEEIISTTPIDPIDDTVNCSIIPDCNKEFLMTIWPHIEPESYWQCEIMASHEGGVWRRAQRKCEQVDGIQLLFNFKEQRCVNPDDWIDYCATEPTDPGLCDKPKCIVPEVENDIKFPHFNPRQYYQCADVGVSVVRTCPLQQLYIEREQRCGNPCNWENVCKANSAKDIIKSLFAKYI
uniref:CSON000994 protein n=1 Tax=Culicoides sonorensis TaxID=179676 RepID=A0A336KXF4_CULSO